ncbi:MAG TPA: tryptophan synthase subunit alpha [Polyangiaceae bacterium]|nr:tryptophan synthase subunit alpha [Polyangiaceae bacterium]
MSRIDRAFAAQRVRKGRVLVVYLCVGDPSLKGSLLCARAALEAGADVLELGVPFSDPTADGPAIARASERAIAAGSSLVRTIETAAELRKRSDAPLVLFGYYNPILIHGEERTVREAKAAGIDALLVIDLPPEEGKILRDAADESDIAIVPLLTPTSGAARIAAATARASGFLYYISVTGVTGKAGDEALSEAALQASRLRDTSKLPVVVGFGIDSPAKARIATGLGASNGAGAGADGIVVGTAVVKAIESGRDDEARAREVSRLVASLRAALDEG